MKQALHIFRKDLRRLWPQTAIAVLLVAAYAVLAGRTSGNPFSFDPAQRQARDVLDLFSVLLPAAWAWLIVTLVHQENLTGNRQFWVTRPYRRASLIAAKTLFVAAFVIAGMVAKDCYIVWAHGFPVLPGLAGLLLRVLVWTAWVVLPALAAGAVTRNLQEVGLLGAGLALIYALDGILMGTFHLRGSFRYANGIEWVRDAAGVILLVIAGAAIVLWQYLRRQTGVARAAVACGAVLMIAGVPLFPWSVAFTAQMLARPPRIDVSKAQIVPDLARAHPVRVDAHPVPEPYTTIALPVRVVGLPDDLTIVPDGLRFALYSGGRALGRSVWQPDPVGIKIERYRQVTFILDNGTYLSLRDRPLRIRISLGLTILEDEPAVSIPAHAPRSAYEFSRCEQWYPERFPSQIWCEAALKSLPRTLMTVSPAGVTEFGAAQVGTWSYAAYPTPLDMDPMYETVLSVIPKQDAREAATALWERPDTRITLTPMRPVAHFRREVEFRGVRLADYAMHVRYELKAFTR